MGGWLSFLVALPLLAFALWLKARPGRNGTNAELWGAPSDQELIEAGLPPRDARSYHAEPERRLFGRSRRTASSRPPPTTIIRLIASDQPLPDWHMTVR